MNILRKLLFPFAILYGLITSIRNYLFDVGIVHSATFEVPIIAVGNLSVGGTGKTPQIEYLIRLLSSKYQVATLSRGYKRQSKGFVLAGATSDAQTLGDEPFQFYKKFPEIIVAVDENRKNGIEQLLQLPEKPNVILLDDAFQHRKVAAGFYILLTTYSELFTDDFILPMGNLRESRRGAQRANVIIVTKCPTDISTSEQNRIKAKIGLDNPVFFSTIEYDNQVFSNEKRVPLNEVKTQPKVLLAGIAKPKPFFDHLKNTNAEIMEFPDHHHFSTSDLLNIENKSKDKIIITTEKDFVRLQNKIPSEKLFYLPIKSKFVTDSSKFDELILDFLKNANYFRA